MIEQEPTPIEEDVVIPLSILSELENIENDVTLCEDKNFGKRIETIDFIEFNLIDRIESLPQKTHQLDEAMALKHRAEEVKTALETVDLNLFKKLRGIIRAGKLSGQRFKMLIAEYVDLNLEPSSEPDYDNLDMLLNGLTSFLPLPEPVNKLQPEMVYYQKTPARVIFELVERCNIASDDVFVDLGCGLGQAAMLVNLLTGVKAIGVEYDAAFCNYATACASQLILTDVTFINADAREADYSAGTLFFMFTPFRGEMMEQVLELLRKESQQRKITVVTYGPCTAQVDLQNWLTRELPADTGDYQLAVFCSGLKQ